MKQDKKDFKNLDKDMWNETTERKSKGKRALETDGSRKTNEKDKRLNPDGERELRKDGGTNIMQKEEGRKTSRERQLKMINAERQMEIEEKHKRITEEEGQTENE